MKKKQIERKKTRNSNGNESYRNLSWMVKPQSCPIGIWCASIPQSNSHSSVNSFIIREECARQIKKQKKKNIILLRLSAPKSITYSARFVSHIDAPHNLNPIGIFTHSIQKNHIRKNPKENDTPKHLHQTRKCNSTPKNKKRQYLNKTEDIETTVCRL